MTVPPPRSYGLPFEDWRPYQYEGVTRILDSTAADVILCAPPGCGKSGIALAVANALDRETTILCGTKALQEQYRLHLEVPVVVGRANFQCAKTGLSAHPGCGGDYEDSTGGCDDDYEPDCPYIQQRETGRASPAVCLNYAYYIRAAGLFKRGFTVADECDLVANHLTRGAEVSLREFHDKTRGSALLALYRQAAKRGQLVFTEHTVHPSDPRVLAPLIAGGWGRRLWMSATVIPDLLADELGLANWEKIELPSAFPAERRPIIFWPVVKMRRDLSEEELAAVIQVIDTIIAAHLPQKGIIHAPSHALCDTIVRRSRYAPLMYARSDDNRHLTEFHAAKVGILVSPSAYRGMDFPYEDARWQIVTKMFFPDLGDPLVRKRREENPEWYELTTLNSLLQAAGRVCRAPDDAGTTYILDKHYMWLRAKHKARLPGYFWAAEQAWRT